MYFSKPEHIKTDPLTVAWEEIWGFGVQYNKIKECIYDQCTAVFFCKSPHGQQ